LHFQFDLVDKEFMDGIGGIGAGADGRGHFGHDGFGVAAELDGGVLRRRLHEGLAEACSVVAMA
jgi:hypothetical protein